LARCVTDGSAMEHSNMALVDADSSISEWAITHRKLTQILGNREDIFIDGILCAMIIPAGYDQPGIQFFTDKSYSQQLASMSYQPGKIIPAHTHNSVRREVSYTQETLFIRRGKVRVDFYSETREYRTSRVLGPGDVILLIRGGHGFEVLEDLNMIEVKQGPYAGEMDKTRFASVFPEKVKIEE
jgi:mannose-6-phosphate isomerase-like protein (cupin superfamily)